jgi:hypothetical protein
MSEIKKVKSPITNEYLTEGKVYEVFNVHPSTNFGYAFNFINDLGVKNFATLKQSAHLNGKDWIVVE